MESISRQVEEREERREGRSSSLAPENNASRFPCFVKGKRNQRVKPQPFPLFSPEHHGAYSDAPTASMYVCTDGFVLVPQAPTMQRRLLKDTISIARCRARSLAC